MPLPISKKSDVEIWDAQFNYTSTFAAYWAIKADSLIRCFDILTDTAKIDTKENPSKPYIYSEPYMLAGFALENIFKGWIIFSKGTAVKDRRFTLKGHKLLELAGKTPLALSSDEKILLERLTEFTEWASRYPVPLHADGIRPRDFPDGSVAPLTNGFILKDYSDIKTFLTKARCLLLPVTYTTDNSSSR